MAKSPNSKNAHKDEVRIELRQREVFRLWREGGKTLREIGEQLKISHEQVRQDRIAFVNRMRSDFDDELKDHLLLQISRLNDQYARFNALATGDEKTKPDVKAGKLVLDIIKEMNDLLNVKSAVKLEIAGKDGSNLIPQSFTVEIVRNDGNADTEKDSN